MNLINFINLGKGEVITAKHLYIVDKDHELLEVKYEKVREWWKNIFVESITVLDSDTGETIVSKINDEQIMKPHVFLNFFRDNHTMSQPKAMYFKDINGNMIEFTNIIHNNWVEDYVLGEKLRVIGVNDIIHYYVTSIVNQIIIVGMVDETSLFHYLDKTHSVLDDLLLVNQAFEDSLICNKNIDIVLNPIELIPEVGLALSDSVLIERR